MNEYMMIEASGSAKPKVTGLAYGGGKINLPGWQYPVVVDLSGMEIPDTVPLLTNHENRTGARVGMISAKINDSTLEISGEIISDSPEAKDIVAQANSGADWQLSIGADVKKYDLVKSGSREVNGKMQDAPFYHIQESVLREVSVVAVGADAATRMKVTANFTLNKGESDIMATEKNQPEIDDNKNAVPPQDEQEKQENETVKEEAKASAVPPAVQAAADFSISAKEAEWSPLTSLIG